jgi:hypothetical protein
MQSKGQIWYCAHFRRYVIPNISTQSSILVVIVNPSCPSQLNAHHSDENADAANLDKENTKMDKYKDWNIHVIPFCS